MSGYRQQPMAYGHQEQQKQQFPPTQHPMMQQPHQPSGYPMQQRHTPHYNQAAGYPTAATQSYGGYMHQRMPHHHQYPQSHHQMDMGVPSVPQTPQYNHMGHGQALGSHGNQNSSHMTTPQVSDDLCVCLFCATSCDVVRATLCTRRRSRNNRRRKTRWRIRIRWATAKRIKACLRCRDRWTWCRLPRSNSRRNTRRPVRWATRVRNTEPRSPN